MAKAWINDRWLTDAVKTLDDGSKVRVAPSAAVKRALSMHMDDPEKAKVPVEFRTSVFGKGPGGRCFGWRMVNVIAVISGITARWTSFGPAWRTTLGPRNT